MLGIDISKDKLACALRDKSTKNLLWEREVPNNSEGFALLLDKIAPETPWVLEPTGRYGQAVVCAAKQAGREVRLASPRKAKQFLQSLSSRAKTDLLDSKGLALFGLACDLPTYPIKEADVETIDQLLSTRKLLAKSITNFQLQQQALTQSTILEQILTGLRQNLADLDTQIAAQVKQTPAFEAAARLDAVPGIGPVVAAAVTSRLVAKSFAHPDQFVAYCGLDIGVRQSGKRQGNLGLSKQGDAEMRRLLYLAAQANLRCKESPFQDQYKREREKGLSSSGALCAVARKLAKVCWSLHKHGTTYESSRVAAKAAPKGTAQTPPENQNPRSLAN